MIALLDVACQLLAQALRFAVVALRPTQALAAENLFLRRQLAMYVERGLKPRRPDVATRVSLVLLSGLFDWRRALVVVRPETLLPWDRAGFRLIWRFEVAPWTTRDPGGIASAHPTHGLGEPAPGRGAHRQRAIAQARVQGPAANSAQIPVLE